MVVLYAIKNMKCILHVEIFKFINKKLSNYLKQNTLENRI